MLAIVLGLSAAILYGSADFLGGIATKRSAMLTVTVIAQAVGFAVLLVAVPFFPAHAGRSDFAWGAAAGVCGALGIAIFYHALSIGKMGVVSPITAVLGSAFPVVVGIARGDRLTPLQLAGIVIALLAVVLISLSTESSGEREISTSGVKEAIVSGVLIGAFLLLLAQAHSAAGLDSLLAARIASVAFLLILAVATRTSLQPRRSDLPIIALCGAMDMMANVFYVLATYTGELAIAAVLTGLYPASTVFLARLVLKERLQLQQRIGVGLALLGVSLIAA
jgi:drug/metabolite transporter (DMT)-like permease